MKSKHCQIYLLLIFTFFYTQQIKAQKNHLNSFHLNGAVKKVSTQGFSVKDSSGIAVKGKTKYAKEDMHFRKNGFLKLKETLSEGNFGSHWKGHYDEKGNITLLERLDAPNQKKTVYENRYNKKDKLVIVKIKSGTNPSWKYIENEFAEIDKNRNEKCFQSGGKRLSYLAEFDTKGNMIKKTNYKSEGKIRSTEIYEYNTKNQVDVKKVLLASGKGNWEIHYERDKNGNPLQENLEWDSGKKKQNIYDYEYDEKGNWILKIYYISGKPYSYEERTIEYF